MRYFALFLVFILLAGCQPEIRKNPDPPKPPAAFEPEFKSEFERLVWLLGNPNFDKRAEAQEKLLAMGKDIIPALEEEAIKTESEDHRHQLKLLIRNISEYRNPNERKDILVKIDMKNTSFKPKEPVAVSLTIKNTGNVPLKLTTPLLRKYSVAFRLDWIADMTFLSGGVEQQMVAKGTSRDEWLSEGWNPTDVTVNPGESLAETLDITDLCMRPARYTVRLSYRWTGVEDFSSNAVNFERVKPAEQEKEPRKEDGDK